MAPLPQKENVMFRQILKYYETKQYKKGLKLAEVILAKFPNHGETLALKGLTLNYLEQKEEAYKFVRQGLKCDASSHVCWHVFGLLYRSDKNYTQAMKCYENALQLDESHIQILRDLSILQIQERELEGFRKTRKKILSLLPQQRASWIGLIIANHLLGERDNALEIFETYANAHANEKIKNFDLSEMVMYKLEIKSETEDQIGALELIDKHKDDVVDRDGWCMLRIKVLLKLDRKDESKEILVDLIDKNPDCKEYYELYDSCFASDTNFSELYESLKSKYPRAYQPRRRALDYAEGDNFKALIDGFLKRYLRKGVPGLYALLQGVLAVEEKAIIIKGLVQNYLDNYHANGTLGDDTKDDPDVLVWLELFLSQIYDSDKDYCKAMEFADKIIEHTPTLIEAYMMKSRIYKHAGNYKLAADFMNEAREMDLADRYLNAKCVRYMLLADRQALAKDTIGLFTREGVDQVDNLVEMQCMWFEQYYGDSSLRVGNYGMALKKFIQVDKHFADIQEDQLDFHSYCMRKMTLRAYVRLLKLEDKVKGHKYFTKCAKSAVKTYINMADKPKNASSLVQGENTEGLSESELKKLRSKQRREAARKAAEEKTTKEKQIAHSNDPQQKKNKDDDPDGLQLLKDCKPLEDVTRFLDPLQKFASDDMETHLLSAEVYIRKNKPFLVLKALNQAQKIDSADPSFQHLLVKFGKHFEGVTELKEAAKVVIDDGLKALLGDKTLKEIADNCMANGLKKNSANIIRLAVQMQYLIDPESKDKCISDLTSLTPTMGTWMDHKNIVECLLKVFEDKESAERYKLQCKGMFPYCTYFV